MLEELANAFYFAFTATVSGVVGALVGRRLRLRDSRLSLRHILQAFLIPVCLTLSIVIAWFVDASAIPTSQYVFAVLAVASVSTMVIAFPYLVGIDIVSRRPIRLRFGLGVLLAAITVICVALAGVTQLEWRTCGLCLVIAMVWVNWIIVAALLVGSIDSGGPTRAACVGALVPTAAFGFTTLFNTFLISSHWQTAVLFVLAYTTALFSSRVCIAVHGRRSSFQPPKTEDTAAIDLPESGETDASGDGERRG